MIINRNCDAFYMGNKEGILVKLINKCFNSNKLNYAFQSPILLNKKFLNAVILAVFLSDCG